MKALNEFEKAEHEAENKGKVEFKMNKELSWELDKDGICSICKKKVEPNVWHEHKELSWEKEFDKLFTWIPFEDAVTKILWSGKAGNRGAEIEIKDFIRSLLAKEKKALLADLNEWLSKNPHSGIEEYEESLKEMEK